MKFLNQNGTLLIKHIHRRGQEQKGAGNQDGGAQTLQKAPDVIE